MPQEWYYSIYDISIHAPPRGATEHSGNVSKEYVISIHAPPRGATRRYCTATKRKSISIHAPPRGATATMYNFDPSIFISIHAPPRGATRHSSPPLHGIHFNSRPSARGDGNAVGAVSYYVIFQFTPLREGRHGAMRRTVC